MDITRFISTHRLIAGFTLAILVATFAAASTDKFSATSKIDRDELEGIAGRELRLVNPPETIEAAFTRESYRPGQRAELRQQRSRR